MILLLFYSIDIENRNSDVEEVIYIDLKEISDLQSEERLQQKIAATKSDKIENRSITKINSKRTIETIDDTLSVIPSHNKSNLDTDSLSQHDSILVKYPTFIALRIALKEQIEKNRIRKTENEELITKIEKSMQDYYKMKYPTPMYKFGEKGSGAGVRIPIDKIMRGAEPS